jgi:NAD(P)-dependent dehydrogenase (short-subunit alcohol dehydrogenase family)
VKILDHFRLDGKVAVVTGAAGLFGRQIGEALAEAGAKTYLASRSAENLEALAQQLLAAGGNVAVAPFDQGDEASCRHLLAQILATDGHIDVLVNNAVARPMANWADSLDAWAESMRVNATGLFCMTRLFGEQMAVQGGGSIINIGSIQGMVGPDFTLYEDLDWTTIPDYFYQKGGMIQLTRFAASKLGSNGVRCNVLCPGGFLSGQEPVFVERYSRRTMLRRMANETDLKGAVVFLASDASAYITAATIPIDGGYTAM